jgi:hypothetical protein
MAMVILDKSVKVVAKGGGMVRFNPHWGWMME